MKIEVTHPEEGGPTPDPDDITELLDQWSSGDPRALESLTPLVLGDLHRLARRHFQREAAHHTLQPTALISEFFVRLLGRRKVQWSNRGQFFQTATELMRHILVDHARRRNASKRGGDVVRIPLDEASVAAGFLDTVDLVALHRAIDRLDSQRRRIVELRIYFGLTHRQIGEELGLAEATVKEKWAFIKARLYRELHHG